ncbi:MAG: ATP-binding protein [Planctomycetaceae bacterium]|nr:ATP-binding protein [Planctomycetaceae bacterium]
MIDYEKLGAFYLGRSFDLHAGELGPDLILYDSKDLTTHAVIVGMTGSGKTGLGVALLEEAAIDGIPALVIDPKGDMGNLLLTFPSLTADDFRPWIEKDEAARKGLTPDEFAADRAELWRNGLAQWDELPERIQRLKDAADFAIYTPGSDAGLPLTVLRSLDAPPPAILDNADAMRERVMAAVSGLLALLGIEGDPIRSREHILLSNILDHAWRQGRNLSMAQLIHEIQNPPFNKIGVMDLETIFTAADLLQLAMTVNNILASPSFAAWREGEPLNIQRLLYTPEGKPRISVVSVAHLSDRERMFFLTILLNEVVTWMRSQPGTTSLRAMLYMDEVFGYLPPTANPPTKTPLLTLLKQARAYGLGLVLATQNPVDLDYKALSNAGTWFLGRLQTERDKQRVVDGLEGATAAAGMRFDRKRIEQILSGVKSRVFLMNNVHEDEPVVFQTRWALSYLRGPLTREQISALMAPRRAEQSAPGTAPSTDPDVPLPQTIAAPLTADALPPVLPAGIAQFFLGVDRTQSVGENLVYRPAIIARGRLHYTDTKSGTDTWREIVRVAQIDGDVPRYVWDECERWDEADQDFEREPHKQVRFVSLPSELAAAKGYTTWKTQLRESIYRSERLTLTFCPTLKVYSRPDEIEGDFRARLRADAREKRDTEVEKLRGKYASRIERARERERKAEQRVEIEKEQADAAKRSAYVSWGSSLLGALLGRKLTSSANVSRAGSAMRSTTRAAQQSSDITRAEADERERQAEREALERELEDQLHQIDDAYHVDSLSFEPYEVKPRKSDISIDTCGLLWLPWRMDENGIAEPAWATN